MIVINFVIENESFLSEKEFHIKLLYILNGIKSPFIFYLDKKNDTIHYIIFDEKIILMQVIFQSIKWKLQYNFDILEYAVKRKKIAKNYLDTIDNIIQYNLIFFPNKMRFSKKKWTFKDDNQKFSKNFYSIFSLNFYYINRYNKTDIYDPLKKFWSSYL